MISNKHEEDSISSKLLLFRKPCEIAQYVIFVFHSIISSLKSMVLRGVNFFIDTLGDCLFTPVSR